MTAGTPRMTSGESQRRARRRARPPRRVAGAGRGTSLLGIVLTVAPWARRPSGVVTTAHFTTREASGLGSPLHGPAPTILGNSAHQRGQSVLVAEVANHGQTPRVPSPRRALSIRPHPGVSAHLRGVGPGALRESGARSAESAGNGCPTRTERPAPAHSEKLQSNQRWYPARAAAAASSASPQPLGGEGGRSKTVRSGWRRHSGARRAQSRRCRSAGRRWRIAVNSARLTSPMSTASPSAALARTLPQGSSNREWPKVWRSPRCVPVWPGAMT